MIPRLRPAVGLHEIAAAFAARSTVEDFEYAFAHMLGQTEAIAFPYGRTGLMLLLEALGISGREIICPAYTCVVVAHAIVLSGNRPVFIDSEPGGFNMDLERAHAAITRNTAAVLATSIHGYPVDLDRLATLQAAHPDVAIVQDCAHSFGAEWKGSPVHKAGVAAVFGLNVSKIITSIFGGIITTDDRDLASRLRALRSRRVSDGGRGLVRAFYLAAASVALMPSVFGMVQRIADLGLLDRFVRYYDEGSVEMPPDHLVQIGRAEASVGLIQCSAYSQIIGRRRKVARFYDQALRPVFDQALPPLIDGATYSHYAMRVPDPDGMVAAARARGIELGRVIDYCIPDMPAYRDLSAGAPCEETRRLNRSVVNIPIWVDDKLATKVVDILRKIG